MYIGPGEINIVSSPGNRSLRSLDPVQTVSSRAFLAGPASTHQLQFLNNNNPPGSAENLGMGNWHGGFISEDHCNTKYMHC